ncbi:hypothetical protein [Hymenobacter elongatus]|uniref:Uncharacterized protein n=1 Tax=Hymenobacter elongatus TaxID=877208 RepID=A0A4Z0PK53_9BACT|nr:hypothetical protein [Hymenobacter elongatus]TGE15439.1 hypothetical protein E5J99_12610 [Hymenobacter elongatus]
MLLFPARALSRALFAALLLLSGLPTLGQHPAAHSADRPSTHGMLVFGDRHIYASHLPMFHSPHHYQVLLELTLSDSARTAYQASRQQFPMETVYTLEPETFVLPDMLRRPQPFRGTLYRGHFERGGTAIARQIPVQIKLVLYFQELVPNTTATPLLLLVGNADEQFVAHRIASQPDFDQIVSVRLAANAGTAMNLQPSALLLATAAAARPLHAKQLLTATPGAGQPPIRLTVVRSLYLEHADLR